MYVRNGGCGKRWSTGIGGRQIQKVSHCHHKELEFYRRAMEATAAECPGQMCTLEKPHQVNVENRGKRVSCRKEGLVAAGGQSWDSSSRNEEKWARRHGILIGGTSKWKYPAGQYLHESETHLYTQQIFMENLQCARHCNKCWWYSCVHSDLVSIFMKLTI